MTMIACTHNHGTPIIISDLLISDAKRVDNLILPSVSDNIMDYLKAENEYHPVYLSQKIYLLKPNVCIAFAGISFYIKQFLEDISMHCNRFPEVQPEHINTFLKEYDQSEFPEDAVCFLLFVAGMHDGKFGIAQFTRGNGMTFESHDFGKVVAIGSGAMDFLKEVAEAGTLTSQLTPGTIEYAIQINSILIGKILAKERATLHTVNKHWGAGFEQVYFYNGQFNRIDDICYILNQGNLDEHGEIDVPIPAVILYYKYKGNILTITGIAPHNGETEVTDAAIIVRYKSFNITQFIVAPLNYKTQLISRSLGKILHSFAREMQWAILLKLEQANIYLPVFMQGRS